LQNIQTTCRGVVAQKAQTEGFVLSLTVHQADSQIASHAHARPYLSLLAKGRYAERAAGTRQIRAGSMLFRRAGYEHANEFGGREVVCFNLEILDPEKHEAANGESLPNGELERPGLVETYSLLHFFRKGVSADILDLQCHEVVQDHLNVGAAGGNPIWVGQVQQLVCDDPRAPVSMQELSRDFQLHPNYMIRKFRQVTGHTLSEYVTRQRLDCSMPKLLWGDGPIVDVALDAGFYDQSHYSRSFKKFFGVSPGVYRRSCRG
jgi:AraC family transcriptional regulator